MIENYLLKEFNDKFVHLNMLRRMLEIKLDQVIASNEELDKMIEYFKSNEEYEYCKILKDKKRPGIGLVFETRDA